MTFEVVGHMEGDQQLASTRGQVPGASAGPAAVQALLDVSVPLQDRHDGRIGLVPQAAEVLGDGAEGLKLAAADRRRWFERHDDPQLSRVAVFYESMARDYAALSSRRRSSDINFLDSSGLCSQRAEA
jgi:hypothetical protein